MIALDKQESGMPWSKLLTASVLLLVFMPYTAVGSPHDEEKQVNASNTCFVGEYSYTITWRDNSASLFLQSKPMNGRGQAVIDKIFDIERDQGVNEVRIAKWSRNGLCAIVKIVAEDGTLTYLCLCMSPGINDRIEAAPLFCETILTTRDNWKIFSIDGNYLGDGIVALIGEEQRVEEDINVFLGTYISKGVVYIHGCPQPPIAGNLSFFENVRLAPQIGYEAEARKYRAASSADNQAE